MNIEQLEEEYKEQMALAGLRCAQARALQNESMPKLTEANRLAKEELDKAQAAYSRWAAAKLSGEILK